MKRKPAKPPKSPTEPPKVKRCSHCGLEKPVDGWPKNAALADGLGAYCRACKRMVERGVITKSPASIDVSGFPPDVALPPKRRAPVPSKLTPELTEDICSVLRRGHTYKAACAHVGLDDRTMRTWMSDALEEKAGPKWAFYCAVRDAEGDGELELVEIVRRAAEIDAAYAKWLLERRHNVDWGRKEQLAVSGVENKPLEVSIVRELITKRIEALAVRVDSSPEAAAPPALGNGPTEAG